jgi:hypothetical protein
VSLSESTLSPARGFVFSDTHNAFRTLSGYVATLNSGSFICAASDKRNPRNAFQVSCDRYDVRFWGRVSSVIVLITVQCLICQHHPGGASGVARTRMHTVYDTSDPTAEYPLGFIPSHVHILCAPFCSLPTPHPVKLQREKMDPHKNKGPTLLTVTPFFPLEKINYSSFRAFNFWLVFLRGRYSIPFSSYSTITPVQAVSPTTPLTQTLTCNQEIKKASCTGPSRYREHFGPSSRISRTTPSFVSSSMQERLDLFAPKLVFIY